MVTFDYYRIFYYVAYHQSFTKAAKELGNNQPNISRCMNNLEAELGCQLMLRGNRGIRLTPSGQKLFEHVAVAFRQLQAGEEELRNELSFQSGQVALAASETALRLVVLPELSRFKQNYPGIAIRIFNHSTTQALRSLQNGLADFAVVASPLSLGSSRDFVSRELYSFREIPIGGPRYFDYAKTVHPLREIARQPMISVGRETGTRELYVQYFMNHGLSFHPELEASSTDQILPMVAFDLGIGFYPEELASEAISHGKVVQIPITEPLPERAFCLVTDRTRPLSPAAKKLLSCFESLRGCPKEQEPTR